MVVQQSAKLKVLVQIQGRTQNLFNMKKTFLEWIKADKKAKWEELLNDIKTGKISPPDWVGKIFTDRIFR